MTRPERLFGIENKFHIACLQCSRFPAWPDDDTLSDTKRLHRSSPRRIPIFIGQRVNLNGSGIDAKPLHNRRQVLTRLRRPSLVRPVEMSHPILLPHAHHPRIVQQSGQFVGVHGALHPHINPTLSHYYFIQFYRMLNKATQQGRR
jgi:hypothetical protein